MAQATSHCYGNNDGKKKFVLKVENFRIADVAGNAYNGNILTTMKVLHSIADGPSQEATMLSLSAEPQSPFVLSHVYRPPVHPQCIDHFLSSKSQFTPPFRATLRGCIVDSQEGDLTQAGQPKCTFALVDDMGCWLQCCAIGRNARSPALQDGNDVVLYYGAGRATVGNNGGYFWLFKDAMIVLVGTKKVQKRMQIDIK